MSSDSKDYGSEYYTATNYSYRVPNRAVNDKLTYLISYKTGKWFRVIPSHLLNRTYNRTNRGGVSEERVTTGHIKKQILSDK